MTNLEKRDSRGRFAKGRSVAPWNKGKRIGGKPRGGGYAAIHIWLAYNFGKADKCENTKCDYKNPKRFEYALIHGQEHGHDREKYMKMCASCHKKYDMTDERRENNRKANLGRKDSKETCEKRGLSIRKAKAWKKPVLGFNIATRRITLFSGQLAAAKALGVSHSSISNNLKGRSKSAGNHIWNYA